MTPGGDMERRLAQALALLLLVLGLLPIANWIPGGHEAPWYAQQLADWSTSSVLVVGVGLIGAMSCARYPGLWREGAWQRLAERWVRGGRLADAVIAVAVALGCAAIAWGVFERYPLNIDEVIQRVQGRIFASGRTWLPAPEYPVFSSATHLLDWNGKVYGQFPAGGPAFLALGTLLGAEWLVNPLATGVAVYLFARLLRRIAEPSGTALAALLLFSAAPFVLFLGGTSMNHVTTMAALMVAALLLVVATNNGRAHPGAAFGCGLALGLAATIRPMDGLAFALPTACWLAARVRHGRAHLGALLASGVGVALPLAALLAVNASQTGDPFRFGYIEMWGVTHQLGFHEAPWGPPHTPWRGLELINLYLLRLQIWLLETPIPSLLAVSVALWCTRRFTPFDRWVIACSGGLLLAYFAYWHDGIYLGPRFLLPLAPWVLLWVARAPQRMLVAGVPLAWRQGVLIAAVVALVGGLAINAPIRGLQYRNSFQSMRIDPDALTEAQGIRNAVILVRESWGGQLMARLWGVGVSRSRAEQIYRSVDACQLDQALAMVEHEGGGAPALEGKLTDALRDTTGLRHLTMSRDSTPRVRPGSRYTPLCLRRIADDGHGFVFFPPMLLARGNNRFLLDLHALNTLVIDSSGAQDLWMLTLPTDSDAQPTLLRVNRDSAWTAWRQEQAEVVERSELRPQP